MIQRLIFGIFLMQIAFSIAAMEQNMVSRRLVSCRDGYGYVMSMEQWKIEESLCLYDKQLKQTQLGLRSPIYTGMVTKEELELFSKALDWKKDETLLYHYVRLPFQERHVLLDIIRESKLDAEKLSKIVLSFYGTGLYMKELIELQKNLLFDVDEKVAHVGNNMTQLITNEKKNKEQLKSYDGMYDDAIERANRKIKRWLEDMK